MMTRKTVSTWPWVLILPALFGFQDVQVFRMRTPVEQTNLLQQATMTPAHALVSEILGVFDANRDGDVDLSEFESYLDTLFQPDSEVKDYLVTLASIIDLDDNGRINRNELLRATSKLVNLVGLEQIGKGFEILGSLQGFRNTTDLVEYIAADFDNVLDSDDDGLVNIDEIHALIHRPVFHGFGLEVGQVAVNSDTNRDGYLSLAETRQFLDALAGDHLWMLRHIYIYFRVSKLAGKLAADAWSNTGH